MTRRIVVTEGNDGPTSYRIVVGRRRWRPGPWWWHVIARREEPVSLAGPFGEFTAPEFTFTCTGGPCPTALDAEAAALQIALHPPEIG